MSLGVVPDSKHAGSLPTATGSPTPPWASRSQFTSDTKSAEGTQTHTVSAPSLRTAHTSSVDHKSWGHLHVRPTGNKLRASKTHLLRFNSLLEPLTGLRKVLYLLSPVDVKHKTQGQGSGKDYGKWRVEDADAPSPLRTLPPSHSLDGITFSEALRTQCSWVLIEGWIQFD